jgi:hypothetical protein
VEECGGEEEVHAFVNIFFPFSSQRIERRLTSRSCHMFYEQRVVDIPDGLPKWSGMSGKSDLIADSPAEDVKKRKREIEDEEKGKDGKESKSSKKS